MKQESKQVKSHWNEIWIDTGFFTKNNFYHISNYGRIKSTKKSSSDETIIKGTKPNNGVIGLNVIQPDKTRGIAYVHKFVATNFVDKPSEEHTYVIHLDEDYLNNKWNNLQWATKEEWIVWTKSKKSFKEGMKKKFAQYKLNETKVRLIKERLGKGKTKKKIIAKTFGVHETTIRGIESGKRWKHVKAKD